MIEGIKHIPKEFLIDRELIFDDEGALIPDPIDLISMLVERHKPLVAHYDMLEGMYLGNTQQIHNRIVESGANNKVVINYPKKLADTITGFNVGNPISYEFEEKEVFGDFIENMTERQENSALWLQAMIFGHTFELVYTFEKQEEFGVGYTYIKPNECVLVFDTTPQMNKLCALIISKQMTIDGKSEKNIYTLYTANEIYKVDADKNVEIIPNALGEVPVIEWQANDYRLSLFEVVGSITEAYNQAFNDKLNSSEYFSEPIFKAINVALPQLQMAIDNAKEQFAITVDEWEENKRRAIGSGKSFLEQYPITPKISLSMQDVKTFYSPMNDKENGQIDVGFIEKPVNDALQENLLERVRKEIFNISGIPDLNREDFGSRSGTSMGYETLAMETMSKTTQMEFSMCLEERINLINKMMNITKEVENIKDIKVTFSNVLPKNNVETANMLQTLATIYDKNIVYAIGDREGVYDAELAIKAREGTMDDGYGLLGETRTQQNDANTEVSRTGEQGDSTKVARSGE